MGYLNNIKNWKKGNMIFNLLGVIFSIIVISCDFVVSIVCWLVIIPVYPAFLINNLFNNPSTIIGVPLILIQYYLMGLVWDKIRGK
ncbi:hypothetical protein CMO93_01820 [Candidatus Woesearchaeota archaeon]|nr:hypothetical protein [Candidatus Woesearchaeota archaeon]|tara:strand:- start:2111 stop:2368 length:258 start_codon:yes stop_codon:yes gene_type:complete